MSVSAGRLGVAALLCVLGTLNGCATRPTTPTPPIPVDLNEIEYWQARGRIGISSADSGGSGSFEWQQDSDQADIRIRGPAGIGSVKLQMNGAGAAPDLKLQAGDGTQLESRAAWDELEARLGAPVPAGHLRFWMLGQAAPGEHRWLDAASSETRTLEQDGWRIEYQRFSSDPGATVPVRLRATSGSTRVRIVIDRWQLHR